MADSRSSRTLPEGLWLCNGAVSEKIPQNFTPLSCIRYMYVVLFLEGINLLQVSLSTDKRINRQIQLLCPCCACVPRIISSPREVPLYVYYVRHIHVVICILLTVFRGWWLFLNLCWDNTSCFLPRTWSAVCSLFALLRESLVCEQWALDASPIRTPHQSGHLTNQDGFWCPKGVRIRGILYTFHLLK